MITNIYYLHTKIDSNIEKTVQNIIKQTQQENIISITFFGICFNNIYHLTLKKIKEVVYTTLNRYIPITFIPEHTVNDKNLYAEIWEINSKKSVLKLNKSLNDVHYLHIIDELYEMICIEGIPSYNNSLPLPQQCTEIFKNIKSILNKHQFTIDDIIRQWNYIGNITGHNKQNEQIYQIYNNARAEFYKEVQWPNGYPAATGIGTDFNGIIVSCIAFKNNVVNKKTIYSLDNPLQVAAHIYSKEVLLGSTPNSIKETPKFERAKLIDIADNVLCFISGTAAIRGEYSVHLQSPQMQTELALDNIEYLISNKNLQNNSCPEFSLEICNLRVYIKNKDHYQIIRSTIEKRMPKTPAIYLFTDICRSELLVEIEGVCQMHQ